MTAVTLVRVALCTWIAASMIGLQSAQSVVDAIWFWLTDRQIFHRSFFETILTVSVYLCFEAYYVSLATSAGPRPPLPRRIDQRSGARHLWRNGTVRVRKLRGRLRELITYVAPLLFLDLILIKKFRDVPWEDMVKSGGYDAEALANATGHLFTTSSSPHSKLNGLPANIGTQHFLLPSTHNFSWHSPVQWTRALPGQPPSARRLTWELLAGLVVYDAIFFVVHLSLHIVPLLFKHVHATHHEHSEIQAQVTNQLDIVERLLLILTANFSLQIIGAHVLTRTLFVPIFVLFLVQNHCGLDVLSYDKIFPKGWAAGPAVHAQHHRLGSVGFAPYFTWWDSLYEHLNGSKESLKARKAQDNAKIALLLDKRQVNGM